MNYNTALTPAPRPVSRYFDSSTSMPTTRWTCGLFVISGYSRAAGASAGGMRQRGPSSSFRVRTFLSPDSGTGCLATELSLALVTFQG